MNKKVLKITFCGIMAAMAIALNKVLSLQLTQYKRPSNITVHKEPLPKTTTRKIKRKEVKGLVKA